VEGAVGLSQKRENLCNPRLEITVHITTRTTAIEKLPVCLSVSCLFVCMCVLTRVAQNITETVSTYAFRRRRHNRELISKTTHLAQYSFIERMLYKDMY